MKVLLIFIFFNFAAGWIGRTSTMRYNSNSLKMKMVLNGMVGNDYSKEFKALHHQFKALHKRKKMTIKEFETEFTIAAKKNEVIVVGASHRSIFRHETYILRTLQNLKKDYKYIILLDTCCGQMSKWQALPQPPEGKPDFNVPSVHWQEVKKKNKKYLFPPIIDNGDYDKLVKADYKFLRTKYDEERDSAFAEAIDKFILNRKRKAGQTKEDLILYFLHELVCFVKGYPLRVNDNTQIHLQHFYLPLDVYDNLDDKDNWFLDRKQREEMEGYVSDILNINENEKKYLVVYEGANKENTSISYYVSEIIKSIGNFVGNFYLKDYISPEEFKPQVDAMDRLESLFLPINFFIYDLTKMVQKIKKNSCELKLEDFSIKDVLWTSEMTKKFIKAEITDISKFESFSIAQDVSNYVTEMEQYVYCIECVPGDSSPRSQFKSTTFFLTVKIKYANNGHDFVFGASVPLWTNGEFYQLETEDRVFGNNFSNFATELVRRLSKDEKIKDLIVPEISSSVYEEMHRIFHKKKKELNSIDLAETLKCDFGLEEASIKKIVEIYDKN